MPITLQSQGMLIVLAAPSGGGKSTVARALLESDSQLAYSISTTTRPPRHDELDGIHYNFVTEEKFRDLIAADSFYEWARVHDNFYGTRRDVVDARLAQGVDVVMDLDVTGSLNVKKANLGAVLIFILPPSFAVLEERLRRRGTDDEAVILKRLRNARMEVHFAEKYDYVVVNDEIEKTISTIRLIVEAERHSANHQTMTISDEDADSSV
ncbi:guanylate kinase [candidate division BRC1 bacterium HGW-BRC1-1]|nr:MAG: guanylate kinase [candidate division BRC1 bacterium HGW-BRC1-1]